MSTTQTEPEPTESKRDRFLDLVDAVNVLARIEAVVGFVFASRRKSRKHKNMKRPAGMVEIRVPRDYGGSGNDIQDILRRHGVITWGGRTNGKHFIMYIKATQAQWGIGILRGKGIDVDSAVDARPTTASTTWQDGPQAAPLTPMPQKPQTPAKRKPKPRQAPSAVSRTLSQVKRWI